MKPMMDRIPGFRLDSQTWRADLLQVLLNVALTLGMLVYAFTVYWAWQQAMWTLIVVDTLVLAAIATLWWRDDLSFRFRALAISLVMYLLATMLLTVAGSVAQVYLLGHVAITTVLLGLRPGLIGVAVDSLTLLGLGLAGMVLLETPTIGLTDNPREWLVITANFLLISSIVALLVGGVLRTLEQALAREVLTQDALRERKTRLETLIDATPDGVLVLGGNGTLLEINPSGLALLESDTAGAVLGRPFDEFVVRKHRKDFRKFHTKICGGHSESIECDVVGLRKRKLHVQIVSAPLMRDGHDNQHLAIARNVTDIHQMAEQVRRTQHLDAVGKLTGGIAHDFNNLLTVILGGTDQLYESLQGDPKLRNDVVAVRSAAEAAAVLTQRLLAFSRQQALEPKPTHVDKLLAGMEPLLRRTLGENVELKISVKDAGACVARVDPHQLENAVLNLCINSRDAMPNGGYLTLEVDSITVAADDALALDDFIPGDYVQLNVTDTGEGMEPDVVSRAFEPFFTTKEVGKGTGLGLSMVYGFVKQSAGHARIYSEPGHGTSLRLYLPFVQGDAYDDTVALAQGMPDIEIVALNDGTAPQKHILVVEDNEAVLKLATRHLSSLGYRTTTAPNGPRAIELLKEDESFDLLFTDVMMPGGMNGRQLAEQAMDLRPGLPVLFASGYTETAVTREVALPQGTSMLSKPYRREELAQKLRQMLDSGYPGSVRRVEPL